MPRPRKREGVGPPSASGRGEGAQALSRVSLSWRWALAAALIVALVGWAGWRLLRPAEGGAEAAKGADGGGAPEAKVATPGAAAPGAGTRQLTAQEIAAAAAPSIATIACQAEIGSAFFVAADLAVANNCTARGAGEEVQAQLADGRELLGRVAWSDAWLDLALLEIPGAAVSPLPMADPTRLAPGERAMVIGAAAGLSATGREVRVSHPARTLFGVVYVQVDAEVGPGDGGGPLLDTKGGVLGVATSRVTGGAGLGLAVPIEYLLGRVRGLPPPGPEEGARWEAIARRAADEDRREVEVYARRWLRPAPLAAAADGSHGLLVAVVRRWPEPVRSTPATVEVRDGERLLCVGSGRVAEWLPLEEGLRRIILDPPEQRRARWAVRNGIARDLTLGLASVEVGHCPPAPASAVVALRGGEEGERPVRYPAALSQADVRSAGEQVEREPAVREERARPEPAGPRGAEEERSWREAFRRARQEVARLESMRDQLRGRSGSASDLVPPDPELSEVEAELGRAREALEDLDRQASQRAIPRAWRR